MYKYQIQYINYCCIYVRWAICESENFEDLHFFMVCKMKEKKQFYAILFLTLSDDVKEVSALLVLFG